jgi:uncharacterized protein
MANTIPPTGPASEPVDLDPLEEFLNSDRAPDDCMGLSDLDGFLTGVAIGPEPLTPSDWLPAIWGDGEPNFETVEEAQAILALIMARYNEILTSLTDDPDGYEPIFWASDEEDEDPVVTDWAAGFLEAVKLRPEAWERLTGDPEAGGMFAAILMLGSDLDELAVEGGELTEEEAEQLLEDGPDLIPEAVLAIHEFWVEQRAKGTAAEGSGAKNGKKPQRRN